MPVLSRSERRRCYRISIILTVDVACISTLIENSRIFDVEIIDCVIEDSNNRPMRCLLVLVPRIPARLYEPYHRTAFGINRAASE